MVVLMTINRMGLRSYASNVFPCLYQGARWCSSKSPTFLDIQMKSVILRDAIQKVKIDDTWEPLSAHRSLQEVDITASMVIWGTEAERRLRTKDGPLLEDKRVLLGRLFNLIQKGSVKLSDDITVSCEGCDTGNYFPLVFSVLTMDEKKRTIRPFFINGSKGMVMKASEVAHKIFHLENKEGMYGDGGVYGGICNSYEGPPSGLDKFRASQNLFFPFRLGVTGSYEDIKKFLADRMSLMGKSGVCCISFLVDGPETKNVFGSNSKEYMFKEEGNHKGVFRKLSKQQHKVILESLPEKEKNPKEEESVPSYLAVTVFKNKNGINDLVSDAGGEVLGEFEDIIVMTDQKKDVNICPLIVRKKQ